MPYGFGQRWPYEQCRFCGQQGFQGNTVHESNCLAGYAECSIRTITLRVRRRLRNVGSVSTRRGMNIIWRCMFICSIIVVRADGDLGNEVGAI